ncbi:MAG TPA: DNA-protecting protein DprA [Firmicutes bacterium]|nr:DNA-protecting protein DprA [Bacillota bacterium]
MSQLSERELWLAVAQIPGIGPRTFYQLLDTFGSMRELWTASTTDIRWMPVKIGKRPLEALLKLRQEFDLEATLSAFQRVGLEVVTLLDDHYPTNLKTIFDPPPVLYYRGDLRATDELAVGIVGARRATPYGREIAMKFARDLACSGITVVSGLARGVDSAAHRGALAGKGRTLAVLGCGLNVTYPPENARLYDQVAAQGAVITEFPLDTAPEARNFPRRNRIISGLSRAVVVVEAAVSSGSLITADFALEQGREVFAVPGPLTSRMSQGTNNLIRQGARLVRKVEDIIEELGITVESTVANGPVLPELTAKEKTVYACFPEGTGSVHIDELVRHSRLTAQDVTAILMMLELKGLVRQLPGKMFFRLPLS